MVDLRVRYKVYCVLRIGHPVTLVVIRKLVFLKS